MDRRKFITTGAILLSGCTGLSGSDGEDIQDSDDDGVIDSEDYAPNDPEVQDKSDLQSTATATATPTASPTPSPSPSPTPTSTPLQEQEFGDDRDEPTPVPDSDGDGVSDTFDDFPENPDYSELHAEDDGEKHLTSGQYWHWRWSQNDGVTIGWTVEVTEGSAIDVIVMDESEFSKFEDGETYEYYTDGSDLETKAASKSITLSAGSYRFILSNLDAGADEPSQVDYNYVRAS